MIDEDLRDFCIADTAINSIVGNDPDSANWGTGRLPSDENGEPLLDVYVWVKIDELPVECLGYNRDPTTQAYVGGLAEFNASIEAISCDTGTAKTLARAIQRRLHGYAGVFGNNIAHMIHVEAKDDTYELVNDFSEAGFTTVALDVLIHADENTEDT